MLRGGKMERFKRILLYANAAAKIEPALRYAARVARHNHGVVTVVDCLETLDDTSNLYQETNPHSPECVEPLREHAAVRSAVGQETHARLAAICEQLRSQGVSALEKVLVGRPAIEITREVLRSGHDVVIRTAQGHRENKEKAFFGTTAIRLMRKCPCPVWVVDPDETDRFDRILAAVDPMTDDTDHTKLNAEVLDLAADLAAWEGGELHVAHA